MMTNILVIDDEESIRFSFQRFLAAEGYNVITAQGYREALARMDETQFDLILADIVLDDGWGIDILQEVMRRNLKTRVIIMTAYPTTETIKASFSMQAIDYLTKPLRQEGLLYCVSKALQQMELREDGGADPVGKACPIAGDAFSARSVTYSSSVNVNAPDRKGTSRMQKGPVCLPVDDQGVSGYEHSSHLPKIS
ncbi:MAG: response regulator [Syntrophobacteraceae bacterium]